MINKTFNSFSLNCGGNLYVFNQPVIMGILNLTPDSFYDGGKYEDVNHALEHCAKMLNEGAQIIDIGGASTRPHAKEISPQEETDRILPVIEKIIHTFPQAILSVDTYQAAVAKTALQAGAHIINDVSGGNMDKNMFDVVAEAQCPYILMHMQGTPQTMQQNPTYKDVCLDIVKDLSSKIQLLESKGVKDIIIDPGFGFGKTMEHNYDLLQNLSLFEKAINRPLLVGLSRKSMFYKTTKHYGK
ncbi:MAG: dihydropteroate synthase [Chitinophagales bacterium]|nr:dihydropteroate synthase [Chitinophagales bacterium]